MNVVGSAAVEVGAKGAGNLDTHMRLRSCRSNMVRTIKDHLKRSFGGRWLTDARKEPSGQEAAIKKPRIESAKEERAKLKNQKTEKCQQQRQRRKQHPVRR